MNTKISNKGFSSIIFFISQSMFLGVGITQILNSAGTGSVFSVILGSIIGLIAILLLLKFLDFEKDLSIFEKIEKLFGNTFGKILNFLITALFLLYFIYTLWSINAYIQNKYLSDTPAIIIDLLFIIPVILCVNKGIKTIAKVSLNLFVITVILILFSISNLITHVEIQNLKPFFNTPFLTILKNAFIFASYFVTPIFMISSIPKNQIENQQKLSKSILIFYIFASISFILLFIFIIGIFGIELSQLFYYPEFTLLKKINYFDFIQHIENILSAQWLYSLFISDVIGLHFIKDYLKYLKMDKKYILLVISLISLITSIFIFKNSTVGYNFVKKYFIIILTIPIFALCVISDIIIIIKKNIVSS